MLQRIGIKHNKLRYVEEIIYYSHISLPKMSVICILDETKPQGELLGVDHAIRIRTTHFGIINKICFVFVYLHLLQCDHNFDAKVNDVSLKKKIDSTWHLI